MERDDRSRVGFLRLGEIVARLKADGNGKEPEDREKLIMWWRGGITTFGSASLQRKLAVCTVLLGLLHEVMKPPKTSSGACLFHSKSG